MYRKIVKSDFLAVYLPFAIMFGITLIFSFFYNYIERYYYDQLTILILFLVNTVILVAFPLIGFGFITARFYTTVAGGNAYFTFAIPAGIDTILLGKLTTAFGLMAASYGLHIYVWWTSFPLPLKQSIMTSSYTLQRTISFFDQHDIIGTYKYGLIAVMILTLLAFVLQMMFAISFAQMFKKYRPVIATIIFLILYFFRDKAEDILIAIASGQAAEEKLDSFKNLSNLRMITAYFDNALTYGIIFSIIFCVLLYWGTRTILTKKLNL